jgi:signal transduction histidine kinase
VSLQQRGVRLKTLFAGGLPAVQADARQTHQVILNVVQNAIDASPEGGEVEVTTATTAGGVQIAVRDHGPGVPADIRKRLFEQLHTTKPRGTGLGLLLSKHIMDRQNGSISVDAASGGGTVVRIEFPVQRS